MNVGTQYGYYPDLKKAALNRNAFQMLTVKRKWHALAAMTFLHCTAEVLIQACTILVQTFASRREIENSNPTHASLTFRGYLYALWKLNISGEGQHREETAIFARYMRSTRTWPAWSAKHYERRSVQSIGIKLFVLWIKRIKTFLLFEVANGARQS